jgi:hypothetical protein
MRRAIANGAVRAVAIHFALDATMQVGVAARECLRRAILIDDAFKTELALSIAMQRRERAVRIVDTAARYLRASGIRGCRDRRRDVEAKTAVTAGREEQGEHMSLSALNASPTAGRSVHGPLASRSASA